MAIVFSICGPMFSGKSEELIWRLRRAIIANKRVLIVKPEDDKLHYKEICSKGKSGNGGRDFVKDLSLPAIEVKHPDDLMKLINENRPDVVGIDEAQFLSKDFIGLFRKLHESREYLNLVIIIAGIDMTSEGEPMGSMPYFLAISDNVDKLKAVCFRCQDYLPTATMSYFIAGKKSDQVSLGAADKYQAVCLKCWTILNG